MRSRSPRGKPTTLEGALGLLHPDVREAVIQASRYLTERRIAHVVVGGVAVNAHGYAVNTTAVDFLVHDAAFFSGTSRLIALAPGPSEIRGSALDVRVDYLSGRTYPDLPRLEHEVDSGASESLPAVIALFPLLYMKLSAWRPKDQGHVIGLLNAGAVDLGAFRAWLRAEARDAIRIEGRLDGLVSQAE